LDRRTRDGIDVSLLWDPRTNGVYVAVMDTRLGGSCEFGVEPDGALEAFWHPYAYVARADARFGQRGIKPDPSLRQSRHQNPEVPDGFNT
jgi:hypothetical protein